MVAATRGFAWLTPEGMEIATQELGLDRRDMAATSAIEPANAPGVLEPLAGSAGALQ
jgi:hypothetical protein